MAMFKAPYKRRLLPTFLISCCVLSAVWQAQAGVSDIIRGIIQLERRGSDFIMEGVENIPVIGKRIYRAYVRRADLPVAPLYKPIPLASFSFQRNNEPKVTYLPLQKVTGESIPICILAGDNTCYDMVQINGMSQAKQRDDKLRFVRGRLVYDRDWRRVQELRQRFNTLQSEYHRASNRVSEADRLKMAEEMSSVAREYKDLATALFNKSVKVMTGSVNPDTIAFMEDNQRIAIDKNGAPLMKNGNLIYMQEKREIGPDGAESTSITYREGTGDNAPVIAQDELQHLNTVYASCFPRFLPKVITYSTLVGAGLLFYHSRRLYVAARKAVIG